MIGTKLAHFHITAHLGSGGMGEVYQATDSKLGRDVAVKLLPEAFARDSDRAARFEREARVLASLNHPNIAGIYGLERVDGRMFLVMEYVPGETLAERIHKARSASPIGRSQKEGIPVDEALEIGKQICEALEAAHEKGIVHRDLKPANIKITPEGKAKVLDFGLAKAYAPQAAAVATNLSHSPTMMTNASIPGVIMGTAAYMSPEQAKGKEVDKRTDIFAFGCVLYEMLSGKRAFDGEDVNDILSAVLRAEPDWTRLPAQTPIAVRKLLQLCLEKNAVNRRHSTGDVRVDLDMAMKSPEETTTPAHGRLRSVVLPVVSALLAGSAITATVLYREAPNSAVVAFDVRPPEGIAWDARSSTAVNRNPGVISPDGRTLAFIGHDSSGKGGIYLRALSATTARLLPGSEDVSEDLFWSPDSRRIGFRTADKIKAIDIADGAIQGFNAGSAFGPYQGGATWGADGTILFGANSLSVLKIDPAGSDPVPVTTLQGLYPQFLPDGRHFIFVHNIVTKGEQPGIYAGSLDSPETKRLIAADSARYAAGYLLYVQQSTLFAQRFDTRSLELTGDAFHIEDSVINGFGGPSYSASNNGVLTYRAGIGSDRQQLAWYDRSGKRIENVGPEGTYAGIDLSPDGKRIAVHRHEGAGGDVWVIDSSKGSMQRLTFDASQENIMPVWSPDGSRIVFGSRRNGKWGIYMKRADGTGDEDRLFESDFPTSPMAWSTDGKFIVFSVIDPKTSQDLWILPLTGGGKAAPLMDSPFVELFAQVSPNGRWIAYMSSESGQAQVYVRPFPSGEGKWQVSSAGGVFPRWRQDGKELFFEVTGGGELQSVTVDDSGPTFESGSPHDLFNANQPATSPPGHFGNYHIYAVSPDGQRFLIPRSRSDVEGEDAETPIAVILNWTGLLKK